MAELDNSRLDIQESSGGENVYKTVVADAKKTRAWAVASLVLGIVSVLCCCISWFGIVAGALSMLFTVISRKSLGYFDSLSVAGMIIAIFGIIFSAVMLMAVLYFAEHPELLEDWTEYSESMSGGGLEVFRIAKGFLHK